MKKKRTKSRELGNGFFKFYYWFSLIFAVLGLVDCVYEFKTNGNIAIPWAVLILSYALTVFVVSIVALFRFKKHKFSRITLVMPIYQIVSFIAAVAIGIIMAVYSVDSLASLLWLIGVSAVLSAFELGFCSYILYKFRH